MGLRQSIRGRVLAVVLGSFALLVGTAAIALVTIVAGVLRAQAESVTTATAGWAAEALATDSPAAVVAAHAEPGAERVIQILDARGRLVAGSPAGLAPIAPALPARATTTTARMGAIPGYDRDSFAVSRAPGRTATGDDLTVVVATPAALEEGPMLALAGTALGTALVLLLAVGTGVRYAVAAALRPVEAMRREVHAITDIGSSGTLAQPPGDDEIARLAVTLNHLLDRLRAADGSRRAFVADAGHELRSPLAAARVSLERLADPGLPPADRQRSAERAGTAIERLGAVVDDLLVLAILDDPAALGTASAAIDLDDLLLRAIRATSASPVTLETHLEPQRLQGDPRLLDRAIRNVLDNAVRHAESTVRVRNSADGATAVVTIDNDGPPVPVADRERVFERFVRLDGARDRDRGGSGLGLAIVARAAARHGGTATAGEAPDGWCRFTLRLPRQAENPSPHAGLGTGTNR